MRFKDWALAWFLAAFAGLAVLICVGVTCAFGWSFLEYASR